MKCTEIAELAPLYLSGELDAGRSAEFAGHLKSCRACALEIHQMMETDASLREAVVAEDVDTNALDQRIRRQIAAERRPRFRWIATAAAVAVGTLLAGLGIRALVASPALYSDAIADHRVEVINRQPRRWVPDRPGIEALAARAGLATSVIAGLTPANYRLERGKLCRLDGRIFLHLVYTDGTRETSVFVRQRDDKPLPGQSRDDSVAAIQTDRLTAVFVTSAHAADLARFATQSL